MTSLAASQSIDNRGPSALYIITDSRITWDHRNQRWDSGQKTFASRTTPDIFGFCGDAFFPPAILRQIVEQLDAGLLSQNENCVEDHHSNIVERLKTSIAEQFGAPIRSFSVFHATREGELMASRFRLWRTRYDAANDRWSDAECELETENSYLAQLDGSGKKLIEKQGLEWVGTNVDGTSRAAIWSFCDALKSGEDPHSGGPPQLVGIWRKGPAQNFGFIWDGKRYFGGLEITAGSASNSVNWFNHLFERCDGISGKRLKGAQPHVKPISF